MSDFSRDKTERLLILLEQETGLFGKIGELTQEQTELLETDDIVGFDHSLDNRQELIIKINGLHQESDILMQSYITHTTTGGGNKRDEVEAAIKRLRDAISQCVKLDDENVFRAKEKAGDYVKQINKLNQSRKSIGAYVQEIPNNPEHFDRKT